VSLNLKTRLLDPKAVDATEDPEAVIVPVDKDPVVHFPVVAVGKIKIAVPVAQASHIRLEIL
jgi:hypothetical protein